MATSCVCHIYHFLQSRFKKKWPSERSRLYFMSEIWSTVMLCCQGRASMCSVCNETEKKCWYPFMKVNKPHQHRGLICGQPSYVQVCTKEILAYGRVACLRRKTWSHLTHLKSKSVKIFSKWSIHSANVFVCLIHKAHTRYYGRHKEGTGTGFIYSIVVC